MSTVFMAVPPLSPELRVQVMEFRHRPERMNRADVAGIQVAAEHQRQVAEFKQRLLCPCRRQSPDNHALPATGGRQGVSLRLFPERRLQRLASNRGSLSARCCRR